MKVALINPAWQLKSYSSWPPLGLLYIGTILRKNGFTVNVLDAAARCWDSEKVLAWVKTVQPDIVGVSAFTQTFLSVIDLVKVLKAWNPSIKIAMGHYHATIEATNILQKYGDIVDYCIRGEGEETFLKLCYFLEASPDADPGEIKGITYRDARGNVVSTGDRPLLDINALPMPDRNMIDFVYRWNFNNFEISNSKFTTMSSSRGCSFNCAYCACSEFAHRQWRPRSPESIAAELALVADQGYTEVSFVDDNFTLNSKRIIRLCELIKKEHIDINWHTDGRADQTSQNMLSWMHAAGCKSLWFGFESVNQRILDLYNKKARAVDYESAIRRSRKAGIDIVVGLFMLGAPTETLDEIKNTLHFALTADIDIPFFHPVDIYSGIRLWKDFVSAGTISPYDKVTVKENGKIYNDVERWETTTNIMELTLPNEQYEAALDEIQHAYRAFYSMERGKILLKQSIRYLRSSFLRKMMGYFMVHIPQAMTLLMQMRNVRPTGFLRYEEPELDNDKFGD